jgi:predicted small lipoprotein YifL
MKHFVLLLMAFMALAACGTKSDLSRPDGKPIPENQQDPSKPPHQIGQ